MIASTAVPHRISPRWFWALLIGVACFGMGQAILPASADLAVDEPFVANAINGSWESMFATFQDDLALPLHFVVLKLWAGVFGERELSLRFPSILFYGGSILVTGLIARRSGGDGAALIAAFLMASSVAMGQTHASSARMYALLGLVVALSIWGAFEIVERTRTGRIVPRWLYGVMGVLFLTGMLTHTIYAFFVCGLMLMVFIWARRAFVRLLIVGLMSGAIYLIPMYPLLIKSQPLQWANKANLEVILWGFRLLWFSVISEIILFVSAILLIIIWRRRGTLPREWLQTAFMVAVIVITGWGASQITPIFVATRTPVLFLSLMCVGVGILFGNAPSRILIVGLVALVGFTSLGSSVVRLRFDHSRARQTVAYVIDHVRCEDRLILTSLSYSEVVYYLRQLNAPECLTLETFPSDTAAHPGWLDQARYVADPQLLEDAGDELLSRLSAPGVGKVWVFWDQDRVDLNQFLHNALNKRWLVRQTLPFYGSYFSKILIYEAR